MSNWQKTITAVLALTSGGGVLYYIAVGNPAQTFPVFGVKDYRIEKSLERGETIGTGILDRGSVATTTSTCFELTYQASTTKGQIIISPEYSDDGAIWKVGATKTFRYTGYGIDHRKTNTARAAERFLRFRISALNANAMIFFNTYDYGC